jgi:hypothetical protein
MEDDNDSCGAKRLNKAMSPGSMTLPTMNNWDMSQAMSPYIPPDMNSIASGSMMNGPPSYNNSRSNQYDFGSSTNAGNNEYSAGNGPLSHLSESVNSLDPLNAMEKSLNEQVSQDRSFDRGFGWTPRLFCCRCPIRLTHRTPLTRPILPEGRRDRPTHREVTAHLAFPQLRITTITVIVQIVVIATTTVGTTLKIQFLKYPRI